MCSGTPSTRTALPLGRSAPTLSRRGRQRAYAAEYVRKWEGAFVRTGRKWEGALSGACLGPQVEMVLVVVRLLLHEVFVALYPFLQREAIHHCAP